MLEQSVGYQLKRAQHALRIQMDNALREVGLTTPQYAALSAIEETPGLSGNKIARRCFVTPQTMNLILANVESAGLIVRHPHPEYGRILQAYLTQVGRACFGRVTTRLVPSKNAWLPISQRISVSN